MSTPPEAEHQIFDETMGEIHPTAIVERDATLGAGVRIGPYCCVGP